MLKTGLIFPVIPENGIAHLIDKQVAGFNRVAADINGLVNNQFYVAGYNLQGALRHDGTAADDRYRDNGDAGLNCQMECSLFERLYRSIAASGPFREGHDGMAFPDDLRGLFQAFHGAFTISPVDGNVTCIPHRGAEQRDPEEFLFGDPTERNRNTGQGNQGIHIALVIGCKNLRPVHKDITAAEYFDGNMGKHQQGPGPESCHFVDAILARTEEGKNNSPETEDCRDGHPHKKQKNRPDHDIFTKINLITGSFLYLIIPVKSIRNSYAKVPEMGFQGKKFIDKPAS